jgi:fatty acyl-CoA reductase
VKNLLAMDREEVRKNEEKLKQGYYNTYTYTKNLAERHLERYRGKIRLVINRPSGIIHCAEEPVPGWIDTVSAIGAVGYPLGMGFAQYEYLPKDIVFDFIPGDYTSNAILASTAHIATLPEGSMRIYQNTSGAVNLFSVQKFFMNAVDYLKYNPFDK